MKSCLKLDFFFIPLTIVMVFYVFVLVSMQHTDVVNVYIRYYKTNCFKLPIFSKLLLKLIRTNLYDSILNMTDMFFL